MKKAIAFLILFSFNLHAQNFKKKEFLKTGWFIDDEKFKIEDTLFLKRMLQYKTDYKTFSREHVMMFYNNGKDVLTILLKKNNSESYEIKVKGRVAKSE